MPDSITAKVDAALDAIKAASGLPEIKIMGTTKSYTLPKKDALFGFPFTLKLDGKETNWYAVTDRNFPWGKLKIHPAKEKGITDTYQHQAFNGEGDKNLPWRTGDLCLKGPSFIFGRFGKDSEPHDPKGRLLWNLKRTIIWYIAALDDKLALPGEPFELPEIPDCHYPQILHDEHHSTLHHWDDHYGKSGIFTMVHREGFGPLIKKFSTRNRNVIREFRWPHSLPPGKEIKGIWWLWPKLPIGPSWVYPATWGELCQQSTGIFQNYPRHLEKIFEMAKETKADVLLLGFPIPRKINGDHSSIYWLTVRFPREITNKNRQPKGFRGWASWIKSPLLSREKLQLNKTTRVDPEYFWARGGFSEGMQSLSFVLTGVGSLGSLVAEALARGGIRQMALIDGELLVSGNLVRHILTARDLETKKVDAVARRLELISPLLNIKNIPRTFPANPRPGDDALSGQVMVDLTGSDQLLGLWAELEWPESKLFFSISVGFEAKRLFIYSVFGTCFPYEHFKENIQPWIEDERDNTTNIEYHWDSPGCWSPLFPARYVDIMLAAAMAVKSMEQVISSGMLEPNLLVYELKEDENGAFTYQQAG